MSCESKPDVISTPMQHRNSHTYMRRRFFFLYHGVLSSATRRVTMGSAVVPTLTILTVAGLVCVLREMGVCKVCPGQSNSRRVWISFSLDLSGGLPGYYIRNIKHMYAKLCPDCYLVPCPPAPLPSGARAQWGAPRSEAARIASHSMTLDPQIRSVPVFRGVRGLEQLFPRRFAPIRPPFPHKYTL